MLQLGRAVELLPPLAADIEFSGTTKARPKEIKLSGQIQLEPSKSCVLSVQCI